MVAYDTRVDDAIEDKVGFPIREGLRSGVTKRCSAEIWITDGSEFKFRSVAGGVKTGKSMRKFKFTRIARGGDRTNAKRAQIA